MNSIKPSLCTKFITPESFRKRMGSKHSTFKGLYELSYLHPKYFSPDEEVLTYENYDEFISYLMFLSVKLEIYVIFEIIFLAI